MNGIICTPPIIDGCSGRPAAHMNFIVCSYHPDTEVVGCRQGDKTFHCADGCPFPCDRKLINCDTSSHEPGCSQCNSADKHWGKTYC